LKIFSFFLLPFSSCGRRGWGMREKDLSVNQGTADFRHKFQSVFSDEKYNINLKSL
jgi:hypothetical protein